ncbi:MAG: DUF2953 domain-containing protein [Oscillospiraceae bacterium]|nr:DUF2953 domain-containing protein [Oscillospiraceae bacterium]
MTALIIIGIIVLLFAFLFSMTIRAEIKFCGGKLDLRVKYMWFTVFALGKEKPDPEPEFPEDSDDREWQQPDDIPDKTGAADDAASEKEVDEDTAAVHDAESAAEDAIDTEEKKLKKESLGEKIENITDLIEKGKIIWKSSQKGLKRIFTHIYIKNLVIDFTIANEDAYKAAMTYGAVSAAVYNIIAVISRLFTTTIRSVDIVCDFDKKEPVFDVEAGIAMRVGTILAAGFSILFGILKNLGKLIGKPKPKPKQKQKHKKQPGSKKAVRV